MTDLTLEALRAQAGFLMTIALVLAGFSMTFWIAAGVFVWRACVSGRARRW